MLYLAFIWHMHQPYYKDILNNEIELPWVRLHGTKDYLDMLLILKDFPKIKQTFNFVPCLIEQIEDYSLNNAKDKFLRLSEKKALELMPQDKAFILENFFKIDVERVVSLHPRYYELYLKKVNHRVFNVRDYLDLQVWFNLAWIDPSFRKTDSELKRLVKKGRFFSEYDKQYVLNYQSEILKNIIPAYKKFFDSGQIEISVTPYFHPILPLIYNTKIAKEANVKSHIPKETFAYPEDAVWHIEKAVSFFKEKFGCSPYGMWPAEEAISEHVLEFIMEAGINWIITDESILFRSLKKKRSPKLLYKHYSLKRDNKILNIIFRDSNLSNMIGFVYHRWQTKNAVEDFMHHLKNITSIFKNEDCLVTIALDGENAWEYYPNDGIDFLRLLYEQLSNSDYIKTTTIREFLETHKVANNISRLAAGSWIEGNFNKWIGSPEKNLAWRYLFEARAKLNNLDSKERDIDLDKARLSLYAAEGSDWFWWYGDNQGEFDVLFRKHLLNFYTIIREKAPSYLLKPIN